MCQSIGLSSIKTIGFGLCSVSSESRVPRPPARMMTFIAVWYWLIHLEASIDWVIHKRGLLFNNGFNLRQTPT